MSVSVKPIITYTQTQGRGYNPRQQRDGSWPQGRGYNPRQQRDGFWPQGRGYNPRQQRDGFWPQGRGYNPRQQRDGSWPQGRGYNPRQQRDGFWPLRGGRAYTRQALLLLGLMCLCYGCSLGQEWSENYALLPGVTASDPSFIDGKPETIGESQRKKGSGNVVTDLDIPSEAIIHLPEKKSLYRIVIHSTNLEEFELMAFNTRGEWDKIHDQRSNKEPVIDIRLNKAVTTTGIKVIVHRTSEDAARRRENVQIRRENVEIAEGQMRRGRYRYYITGPTTALAKISEIELYGYAN